MVSTILHLNQNTTTLRDVIFFTHFLFFRIPTMIIRVTYRMAFRDWGSHESPGFDPERHSAILFFLFHLEHVLG